MRRRSARVDLRGERNLDVVARIAAELAERIRDEDPARLFNELVSLCQYHPAKAAQLLMTHAAWLDPDTPVSVLTDRAEAISAARVARVMGRPA
jgi:hypothetical protein